MEKVFERKISSHVQPTNLSIVGFNKNRGLTIFR